jgi:SH3 domain
MFPCDTKSSPGLLQHDEFRYSRAYRFTTASPGEEMHGKAVAIFDFQRENENKLPLIKGQVGWVSNRQSRGWLVAEDPKHLAN